MQSVHWYIEIHPPRNALPPSERALSRASAMKNAFKEYLICVPTINRAQNWAIL